MESLAAQTRIPDEVIVVLKPSGDGTEEVLRRFRDLPLRVVEQRGGNVVEAYELGIEAARGDVLLFLDDDAVADERWVEEYEAFFAEMRQAGGAYGPVYVGRLNDGGVVKTAELMYPQTPTREIFYRSPLPLFEGYCGWVSRSGFMGRRPCSLPHLGALPGGANMAWRREAVAGCPIAELYRKSRLGFWFESVLAYCARARGLHVYALPSPPVWHIQHGDSLTRRRGFWQEFWMHYDRAANFWRLKRLGAEASLPAYLAALAASLRRNTPPRLLATLYVLFARY